MIYIFGTLGVMYLTSNIGKMIFSDMMGRPLGFMEILIISSIIIIFLSFYIPFQYHDLKSAQIFSAILYMFIILSPNLIERFNIDINKLNFIQKILSLDFGMLGFILIGLGLVLYLISSFVSMGIYAGKEF